MNHRFTDHTWDLGTSVSCLTLTRIPHWTEIIILNNAPYFYQLSIGTMGGVQHKWYQGSKSCLIYLAGAVCKMYCPAKVYKSRTGQGTLVLISRNIIHGTKAAALVTKYHSNQDKESTSLLLTVGQISCNVQSLQQACLTYREFCWILLLWKKGNKTTYLKYNDHLDFYMNHHIICTHISCCPHYCST